MTDHANELRRYARKIAHPAGDVPSVMLAAAEEIERLAARLEAAEKSDAESIAMYRKARDERDALRAKIEAMERQKPVGKFAQHPSNGLWEQDGYGDNPEASPLYALPGAKAQNATSVPSEEDESVRKAWSRFSNELHRGPDAPYPGMSEAFEQHFSQSFTDRDWRAESGTWAAAWKAAKRHGAQPAQSVPDISDDMIEAIESRAEQSYRRRHSGIRGQQITPADALSWHIIHATRSVLVEAMETSRAP